ncbi:AzlD domain-containing protein [Shewanella sp. A32]|uniref:AzlD domain-containing protein n=1 Tax=Shewanella sp. A32 TaxID=3031327 RepID=UPI0023B8A25A|nr:AzlD domain-containing protein [Shewanella sp. A32]MDF0533416.1 AzlD domain-containing protein [Shewanella sp. A32]
MSWLLLLTLAVIVFFNRYLFLEPKLPLRIPKLVREALSYSAPCLLIAICAPVILVDHGTLRPLPDNPYLWGAIIAVVIAYVVRHMLSAVALSLLAFYLLNWRMSAS